MELPDIVQIARNFAVMVRIQGPDPKGLKMRKHAFHLHHSGNTTLSASGLLLPPGSLRDSPIIDHICSSHHHSGAVVVTSASIVEPFLTAQHRDNPTQALFPKLIPDARIDVLVERKTEDNSLEFDKDPCWHPSQLLALVDVSASSLALQSLAGVHSGLSEYSSWEAGWSLASLNEDPQSTVDAFQRQVGNHITSLPESSRKYEESSSLDFAKSATRIAFLGVSTADHKDMLHIDISQPQRGDLLLVMGSPFGVLSPLHFLNSISFGAVANCYPPGPYHSSLLMADIRCLPGMEGGPAFNRHACLVGILTKPLRQKGGGAEIQLVITWDAIATAWDNGLQKEAQRAQGELLGRSINSVRKPSLPNRNNSRTSIKSIPEGPDFSFHSQSSFERAIASVVLITVGDSAWASGIVLSNDGIILTNAHLLEPWRFGRTSLMSLMNETTVLSVKPGTSVSQREGIDGEEERQVLLPSKSSLSNAFVGDEREASLFGSSLRTYKRISVRLDHVEPQTWCDARVLYVSKGPLDVALLQLESIPNQLFAITPDFACPSPGLKVHVIGHGLLGPRSDVHPSVSSGVLGKVVRTPRALHLYEGSITDTEERLVPIILQTTAAVHPGASGGAVVNSDGHIIGLVTSNARHGGGTIIPHLNFSIPCAALEPIFRFSGKRDLAVLEVLDKPNEFLSSVWALVPPPSPKPQSPQEKKTREGRGSRFSKFLAEHAEYTPLKDQQHLVKKKFPEDICHRSKI